MLVNESVYLTNCIYWRICIAFNTNYIKPAEFANLKEWVKSDSVEILLVQNEQ